MSLHAVACDEALAELKRFDAVIDARSPAEFAQDHLPGAVNWPVLDDAQRHSVGKLYVQDSPLAARKVGAALVARNIAAHLERWIAEQARDWQPLVYCWRGGQRSGALAWFLDQIGFRTAKLTGGYKGYRERVRSDLSTLPSQFNFKVLAGRTGSGKTRLLQALAAQGAQVLDLEGLACHRGSVLGAVPGLPQPSQKRFDSLLWTTLRGLDATRPVYVESESRKIGQVQLPMALSERMHADGRCILVEMDDAARVQLLLQEYGFFAADVEGFCRLLDGLITLRGHGLVQAWQAQARAGQWAEVFAALMHQHYDPLYMRAIRQRYARLDESPQVQLGDAGEQALARAAVQLLQT